MPTGQIHTKKSWNELCAELVKEFKMWDIPRHDIILPAFKQAEQETQVTIEFLKNGEWQKLSCSKFSTQWHGIQCNLLALIKVINSIRLADQRGIGEVLAQAASMFALPNPDDPHRILGVTESATISEIRAAYHNKLMTVHPDRGGSVEAFKRVQEAATVLGVVQSP